MKIVIFSAALMTSLAAPAAFAQNAAYPDPGDDAPNYVSEEHVTHSDDDPDNYAAAPNTDEMDISVEGAGSGESGLGEDDYDAPPGAPVPEE